MYVNFQVFGANRLAPCFAHKETDMKIVIYVLMTLCAVLLIICYALLVMAHDADEKAERMYRQWKEGQNADNRDQGSW